MRLALLILLLLPRLISAQTIGGFSLSSPPIATAGGGGGSSSALTLRPLGSWTNDAAGSATTLATTINATSEPLGILFAAAKNEGAGTITSVTAQGPSTSVSMTAMTGLQHGNGDMYSRVFYITNSVAWTNIIVNYSGSMPFRHATITQLKASSNPVLDADVVASGTGTAISSGNITNTGPGVIFGAYAGYSGTLVYNAAVGTNGGWNFPEAGATHSMWGVPSPGSNYTAAATLVAPASVAWICHAIAFKGSGADANANVTTNYPDVYIDMGGQTNATTLTTSIMANGSHAWAPVLDWTLSPGTPTGYTIESSFASPTLPIVVGTNGVFNTNATTHCFALDCNTTFTYARFGVYRHPQVVVSGFVYLGSTNGNVGSPLFDMVRVEQLTDGHIGIIQLNKNGYNVGVETDASGTVHSTGFTGTPTGWYQFSFLVDFLNSIFRFKALDSGGSVVVNESGGLFAASTKGVVAILLGNDEAGVGGTDKNKFQHVTVDYVAAVYPRKL